MTQEFKSRRRNIDAKVGFVNFPIDKIESSGEGGLFVRLVVIDNNPYENKFIPCCGGYQNFFMDESFLGDDLLDEQLKNIDSQPKGIDENFLRSQNDERYFPNINNHDEEFERVRWLSRDFLAVLTIGATGWSDSWRCSFSDLTDEGKALVETMKILYPGCEIRLLTFLDT